MAWYFNHDYPVLFFGPSQYKRPTNQHYILWPVLLYRVVAPVPKNRRLDIFQKTILELCSAGEIMPQSIAAKLYLDIDLVNLILQELQARAWLDHRRRLTTTGQKMLDEERSKMQERVELKVGYVFRDPWRGKLWPRFEEYLKYADVRMHRDLERPEVELGTKGNPKRISPFVKQWPNKILEIPPRAIDILDAVRSHRRTQKGRPVGLCTDKGGTEELSPTITEKSARPPHLDRILSISNEPIKAYLVTFAYQCNNGWHIGDPFKLRRSRFLKSLIKDLIDEDKALADFLNRYFRDLIQDDKGEVSTMIVQAASPADAESELELSIRSNLEPESVDSLMPETKVDLLTIEREVFFGDINDQGLTDILLISQKILFRELNVFCHKCLNEPDFLLIKSNRQYNEQLLKQIALYLGFESVPTSVLRADPLGIISAIHCEGESLAALVAAALLSAQNCLRHPFRVAAMYNPQLLNWFGEIIDHINLVSLGRSSNLSNSDIIEAHHQILYDILRALISGMTH